MASIADRAATAALFSSDSVLGVERGATAAQIKQAYRRLALRSHPDVNKAPDAEATFAKIAEAYSVLSDEKKRATYNRGAGSWSSASSSSRRRSSSTTDPWSGFDPSDPTGWATRSRDPAAQAAAEERRRRWREENPTPDELGDSFGSLFNDVVSGVVQAVSGSGDWLSLLDELTLADGPELATLLRSRDVSMLREELESSRWVQQTLGNRIERLEREVKDADADLVDFRRDNARVSGGSGAGSMSRSLERDLERDVRRRRERLADARRLLAQAKTREQRIEARITEVRNGPPAGSGSGTRSKPRALPSVDDELEMLKKKMGK
jgi:curved DNA-binding protein CbpA